MSGRVVAFSGSVHDQVEQLLPWYCNRTLSADEIRVVERHLQDCPACRAECGAQVMAQADYLRIDVAEASCEAALARLQQQLQGPPPAARWWRMLVAWWAATPTPMRYTMAAQGLLIVALALWRPLDSASDTAEYRTLGDATLARASAVDAGGRARFVLVFQPDLQVASLQKLLQLHDARIIDGPNDAGAYVVDAPLANASQIRAALHAAPGVMMIERLDATAVQR